MITELSDAQRQTLREVRDEWAAHGLSTEPADRERAEAAIREIYRAVGKACPATFVWHGSPAAGYRDRIVNRTSDFDYLDDIKRWASGRPGETIKGYMDNKAWHQLRGEVGSPLRGPVWNRLGLTIFGAAHREVDPPFTGEVNFGQHDAYWLAEWDSYEALGIPMKPETAAYREVAKSAGWWWATKDQIILTERPSRIETDEQGRLHSGTAKAVEYPDGWGIYAWHGVVVPEEVILHPNSLDPREIINERNAEVRACMIERFGADRLMLASDAELIHEDRFGKLWRLYLPTDEEWEQQDLVMVEVRNSTPEPDGSFRTYMLRVPPEMRTAHEAVAWTFNQTPQTYRPEIET